MKKQKRLLYLLSFFIPVIVMLIIFWKNEIFPFGDRSFLNIDMYHQYFPFLSEFYHKLKNGESLFYSWNTGIGSNFLALYVYYLATPFNWLAALCPEQYLMEFITYLVVVKIGLCGVTFTHYMHKHFQTTSWSVLCFSMFYALSGYMAAFNWNVMWLDVIVIAPIVILGLEQLVHEGKCKLYCLTLAFSILTNYYLSIMLCIFLVLYFFVLLISKDPQKNLSPKALAFPGLAKIQNFHLKAIIRFAVYSLLAGGMAAILLFPEIVAISATEFGNSTFPKEIKTYFTTIDMLARHCFNVEIETGLDHWPNIYCGVAAFLLLPLYIMQKKIPFREKAPRVILIAFMLISFSTNVLNFIWHGFNYPDSLPCRQSFLYIFMVLVMCYEAYRHIRDHAQSELTAAYIGVFAFVLLCEKLITDDAFGETTFLYTLILLVIYAVLLHLYRTSHKHVRIVGIVAICLVVVEAGYNTYLTSCSTVSRSTYLSNYDTYQELTSSVMEEEDDFFRFEKFARRTQNDAMLIGFPAASYFSSTSNALAKDFYENYGMKSSKVYYCYDGATPVTAALLANRYMLYTLDRGEDTVFDLVKQEGKLYLYKNNYSLPFGYMIDSSFTTPIEEALATEDTSKMDPVSRQNALVAQITEGSQPFVSISVTNNNDEASITIPATGHYYAYTSNTKIDTINMHYGSKDKEYKQIDREYILDLGYHTIGTELTFDSENGKALNLSAYYLNEAALSDFIDTLSAQTMTVDSYDETSVEGHITVTQPGSLVLSVPYETGWTVKVDGEKVENIELFEKTFISIPLTQGEHTISISFYPGGFTLGIIVSLISIGLFIGLCYMTKRKNVR